MGVGVRTQSAVWGRGVRRVWGCQGMFGQKGALPSRASRKLQLPSIALFPRRRTAIGSVGDVDGVSENKTRSSPRMGRVSCGLVGVQSRQDLRRGRGHLPNRRRQALHRRRDRGRLHGRHRLQVRPGAGLGHCLSRAWRRLRLGSELRRARSQRPPEHMKPHSKRS